MQKIIEGGRPSRKRSIGRPKKNGYRDVIYHVKSIAPLSYWPQSEARCGMSVVESCSRIVCPICLDTPDKVIELIPCNSHVCSECLCLSLEASQQMSCPCCYSNHISDSSTIRAVTPFVDSMIGSTLYNCQSCNENVTLVNILPHYNSSCRMMGFTHCSAISAVLSRANSSTLTDTERRLTTHLVRRSLQQDNGILQVHVETSGQVLFFPTIDYSHAT